MSEGFANTLLMFWQQKLNNFELQNKWWIIYWICYTTHKVIFTINISLHRMNE